MQGRSGDPQGPLGNQQKFELGLTTPHTAPGLTEGVQWEDRQAATTEMNRSERELGPPQGCGPSSLSRSLRTDQEGFRSKLWAHKGEVKKYLVGSGVLGSMELHERTRPRNPPRPATTTPRLNFPFVNVGRRSLWLNLDCNINKTVRAC